MIVKKDGFDFYADKNRCPDVLLYAPNNQERIYEYIVHNKIKKIALCGGGEPTQEYLDSIIDFEWLEYINGSGKNLDYKFINQLPKLRVCIGVLDYEFFSRSVEELYVDYNKNGKILPACNNLKILTVYKLKSFETFFADNKFPENLRDLSFIQGLFLEFPKIIENSKNIERLEIALCSKLKSLNGIESFEGLKKLRIDRCKMIDDISILARLENLEELEIVKQSHIKDFSIVNKFANLKTLRVIE